MLYSPKVRINLINGSFLAFKGYKIILKSNNLIITRNNEFVRKDFKFEDLFTLNIIP